MREVHLYSEEAYELLGRPKNLSIEEHRLLNEFDEREDFITHVNNSRLSWFGEHFICPQKILISGSTILRLPNIIETKGELNFSLSAINDLPSKVKAYKLVFEACNINKCRLPRDVEAEIIDFSNMTLTNDFEEISEESWRRVFKIYAFNLKTTDRNLRFLEKHDIKKKLMKINVC